MLADDILDPDEQRELLTLLSDLTGEAESVQYEAPSLSTHLPLTDPLPEVSFANRVFCFTGKFIHGTRRECDAEVVSRGGAAKSSPTRTTDYLVIGHLGSTDWIHSSHGRKIERAVELAQGGHPIQLISEPHWVQFVAEG